MPTLKSTIRAGITSSVAALAVLLTAGDVAAQALPSFNVDKTQISVSGISSGGFMATQFHVAFSQSIMGAGVVAGGPYYCSNGNAIVAMTTCMSAVFGGPDPAQLINFTQTQATLYTIDNPQNLQRARVYLFSGTEDTVVNTSVVDALNTYYQYFVPAANISYIKTINAEHSFVTNYASNACGYLGSPFLDNCSYDQAGAILQQIYGNSLTPPGPANGTLTSFDQSEFISDPALHSMAEKGYLYVPTQCSGGAQCRVHVAFHGCGQAAELIGNDFYTETGYNQWAETNNILVLYPQLISTLPNPMGCWDFWGYDSDNFYTQSGNQMAAVKAMIDRLAAGRSTN